MTKKVTILDLEKASGVSKSTISRYLQGVPVGADKQVRIEKAIDELAFVRNSFAHYLRSQESNLIGVLVPDLDNPYFLTIIKVLDQLAEAAGRSLIIKTTRSDEMLEKKSLQFIQGFLIRHVITCRSELSEETVEALSERIKIVSIDRPFQSIPSVVSNNYENGYQITAHLADVEPGPLMFFARRKENVSVLERIEGFKNRLKELGRTPLEYRYASKDDIDYENLKAFVLKHDIKGIISRNDNDALKIMTYLNDLSFKGEIGRIKIAGFDNIDLAKRITPQLTTIDQEISKMCEKAFEALFEYQKTPQTIVHTGQLIKRESTL